MSSSAYNLEEGMATQLTLVDSCAYGVPHTFVSLESDDMRNTRIYAADGPLLYTIETDTKTRAHTVVYREGSRDAIAEVKRKDLRADRIKFGNEKSMELKSWLYGASGKWSDFPASFDWQGRKFTWMTNKAKQITLYNDSDPSHPIAWFQSSRKEVYDGSLRIYRALLALEVGAQDAVVISLLVVENGLRWREIQYQNAEALAMLHH